MKLHAATANYLYYFKKTRTPIVWIWGVDKKEAELISKALYIGDPDYLIGNEKIVDALIKQPKDAKKLSVDVMLVDTSAAPIGFLKEYLNKSRVYVVKTESADTIKQIFKDDELTLVDEIDLGKGISQLTWVRSNKLRR